MLAIATVNNTEQTVYTTPSNKKAMVELLINPSELALVSVKIGNTLLYSELIDGFQKLKLMLTAGDTIKVFADRTCYVFVQGMEV